jgi:2-dehydropantoate 2-reductase
MKIAVVGTGALGQFYGAQLLLAGHEVHFIARRDADVLTQRGLVIHQVPTNQVASTATLPLIQRHPVAVHRDAAGIGPVDWIVVTLKTTGLDALGPLVPDLLGSETRLTVLCNGLGIEERIAAWVPPDRIFGQLCFVCVNRDDDGTVRHLAHGAVAVGSLAGAPVDALADLWTGAGVRCHRPASLLEARWRKLVWNIPFNGLATVHDTTTDVLMAQHAEELHRLMAETIAIANADLAASRRAERIEEAWAEEQFRRTSEMGAYAPSTLLDARAGRPLERDALFDEPLRRAERLGVPAPLLVGLIARLP